MTLPTGTIYLSQVNTELGKSSTSQINLNDGDVRKLAQDTVGSIYMSSLRGKDAGEVFTLNASNQGSANKAGVDLTDSTPYGSFSKNIYVFGAYKVEMIRILQFTSSSGLLQLRCRGNIKNSVDFTYMLINNTQYNVSDAQITDNSGSSFQDPATVVSWNYQGNPLFVKNTSYSMRLGLGGTE